MKWYNYSMHWINLECCNYIKISGRTPQMEFHMNNGDTLEFVMKDKQERDAEFEKIKALMGVSIAQDWTPGRCC